MYLKRLDLHGFKSFAHKTVLEFDPGLTAIVGPNGAGKSNIADAIRWVTGEQSLKLLRGKKSEDVIFAGSDKKTRLSVAEVLLTFDNKDHKLPFEYSEVVIARRIYRDGESEYLINNQKSRLIDIVEALLKSGFGATNYAVIGQGLIDQMILAGPAEIKNLVEEAAGVKPYYLKREKTLRRLDVTESNLTQVSQLVSEIEPRLKSLKRQARRMEEREKVAEELSNYQLEYYGHEYFLVESEVSNLNAKLKEKNREVDQLESEIENFQRTLEKEEQENKSASSYSYELANKIDALEARRLKILEELAEIRGKIKADLLPGSMDLQSLNAEKLNLQRQVDELSVKVKSLTAENKKDKENYSKLKNELSSLVQKINEFKNGKFDFSKFNLALEQFQNEFNTTLQMLSSNNFAELKSKLKQLVQNFTAESKKYLLDPASNVDLSVAKDRLQEELHRLELKMVEGQTLIQTYSEQLASDTSKLNQIKSLSNKNPGNFKNELYRQENELNSILAQLISQIEDLKFSLTKLKLDERNKKLFLTEEEKKFRKKNIQLNQVKNEQNSLLVEKMRWDTKLEALEATAKESLGHKFYQLDSFKKASIEPGVEEKIPRLKKQLELAGGVDETTLNEYRETEERFNYLTKQSSDLAKATEDLRKIIEELDEVIKLQFDEAFENISQKFSEYFRILFNGGRASMHLLREEVIRTEAEQELIVQDLNEEEAQKSSKAIVGIEIKAIPPGKKLSTITALSGGERALTAIALLCSMLASYPSPFVVLDEVDAALDEANSIRFGKILGTLAHQTQFITITHNRETMRQAHTLYGVTMGDDGISKILSIKLEKAEEIVNL